jgi:hypothetical protein
MFRSTVFFAAVIFTAIISADPFLQNHSDQMMTNIKIGAFGVQITYAAETADMNGDGIDEILLSAYVSDCAAQSPLALFIISRDSNNVYKPHEIVRPGALYLTSLQPSASQSERDILVCSSSSFELHYFSNQGNLSFLDSTGTSIAAGLACGDGGGINFVDADNDGVDEVLLASNTGSNYYAGYFARAPNGTLVLSSYLFLTSYPVLKSPSLSTGDLNGDTFLDIGWYGVDDMYNPTAYIFSNVGSGRFNLSTVLTPAGPSDGKISVGQFSGDSLNDVLLSSGNVILVYENVGGYNFSAHVVATLNTSAAFGSRTVGVKLFSSNALDIAVGYSGFYTPIILRNLGNGSFVDAAANIYRGNGYIIQGPELGIQPTILCFRRGIFVSDLEFSVTALSSFSPESLASVYTSFFGYSSTPVSITFGGTILIDINYDGCLDVFMYGYTVLGAFDEFLAGNCDSTFVPTIIPAPVTKFDSLVLWDDFFRYGNIQIAVFSDTSGAQFNEYQRNGSVITHNSFIVFPSYYASAMTGAAGDVNGDGYSDIVAFTSSSSFTHGFLYVNIRNGSFENQFSSLGVNQSVANGRCGLLNRIGSKGYQDIVVFGENESFFIQNLQNGSFFVTPHFLPNLTLVMLLVGDLDNDGSDDLFINGQLLGTQSRIKAMLFRAPDGGWLDRSFLLSNYTANFSTGMLADIDGEGSLDFAMTGSLDPLNSASSLMVYLNNGTGSFRDATSEMVGVVDGFQYGSLAAGFFSNASTPGVIATGRKFGSCGPQLFLPSARLVTTGSQPPSNSDNSTSDMAGSVIAALVVGPIAAVLFLCLVLLACLALSCCAMLLCACLVSVAAVVILVLSLVGGGSVVVGSTTVTSYLLTRRREKAESKGSGDVEATRPSFRVDDVGARVIPWCDIHDLRLLAQSATGSVHSAEWDGVEVAVKLFEASSDFADDFRHEVQMLARISFHPSVVQLFGVSAPDSGRAAIVQQLCSGGSLIDALKNGAVSKSRKIQALRDVSSALAFLHTLGIVHRDVAARNVLLDGARSAKLSDFGLSCDMSRPCDGASDPLLGPVRWLAPEILSDWRQFSAASDAYAFGVLMYEVWSDGNVPFEELHSVTEVSVAVTQGHRPSVPPAAPKRHKTLMRRLWSAEPAERPSLSEVHTILGGQEMDHKIDSLNIEPVQEEYFAAVMLQKN